MKSKIKSILRPYYHAIKALYSFPGGFYRYYEEQKLSPSQLKFIESLQFFKAEVSPNTSKGIVLVQVVKDYENILKFASSSKILAEKQNLEVKFYDVDWTAKIGWASPYKKLYEKLFTPTINNIYKAFGGEVIFHFDSDYPDKQFITQKLNKLKSEIKNPEDVLKISFDGILVGDLIYDTYLRYFHQPTIEHISKELHLVMEIALNVFYNFLEFIDKSKNIKALINMYSSYIDHGISARICLEKNIPVYTIGSYTYLIQKLEKNFPYHQINHTLFSPDKPLSNQQLELAKQKLTSRFEGKIDAATSYMRASAFSDRPIPAALKQKFTERPRNIVVYVHDFYDSPHVNRMLQFPDLYQFLKQTLAALVDLQNTTVFIKTHPNGIEGCKEKTIELVQGFKAKHFEILDEEVSNIHIIELRPDLIATARGTVCLEMAYFTIPTVALFDNLYTSFGFTHTCKNTSQFFSILKGEEKPKIDFEKEKIFSFYYQAFLEKKEDIKSDIFDQLASFKGNTYNDQYLDFILSSDYPQKRSEIVASYSNAINKLT